MFKSSRKVAAAWKVSAVCLWRCKYNDNSLDRVKRTLLLYWPGQHDPLSEMSRVRIAQRMLGLLYHPESHRYLHFRL
jgi:hypothetical protein